MNKKRGNFYLDNNLIPLGRNTYMDRIKERLPVYSQYDYYENVKRKQVTLPYKRNGIITFLGGSSSGKSVRAKSVFTWLMHPDYFGGKYKRSAVIFDFQGDDHRLIVHPNGKLGNRPFPLVYDIEKPIGFNKDDIINYTPFYLKEDCFFDDNFFSFDLLDFDDSDWNSLRITEAGLETLQDLIDANKKIAKDPREFYRQFKLIRTGNKGINVSQLNVEENITEQQKVHLRSLIKRLIKEKVVNNKYKKDFLKQLEENKILIFNFHEDERFSPFYISPIARNMYKQARYSTRKYGYKKLNPILLIEEAQIVLNKMDRELKEGGNKWVTKYLKQGNKYQNLVLLVTQAISEVNKVVKDHAIKQEVILSNPVVSDIKYFSNIWQPAVLNVIKSLRLELREFAIVTEGGNYVETFISNNSMTQIHLR